MKNVLLAGLGLSALVAAPAMAADMPLKASARPIANKAADRVSEEVRTNR